MKSAQDEVQLKTATNIEVDQSTFNELKSVFSDPNKPEHKQFWDDVWGSLTDHAGANLQKPVWSGS